MLRTLSLALPLLLAACVKPAPLFEDKGVDGFERHPYDFRQKPQFALKGAYSGFNELYVEPTDVSAVRPTKPPPTAPVVPVTPELPQGALPALSIAVRDDAVGEGRSFSDVVSAVQSAQSGLLLTAPFVRTVLVPAPASERDQAKLQRKLEKLNVAGESLSDIATITLLETLPVPLQKAHIADSSEGEPTGLVVFEPAPPPRSYPAKDVLHFENDFTAWAEVTINGTKLGVLGPLVLAEIQGVKPGTYDVTFTLPNGFSVTRSIGTASLQAPAVPTDGSATEI